MARTSKSRGATPFSMKSGNLSTFKMMGSSPMRESPTDPPQKGDTFTVASDTQSTKELERIKSSKGSKSDALANKYGGTWTKKPQSYDERGNATGGWRNSQGQSVADAETTFLTPSEG